MSTKKILTFKEPLGTHRNVVSRIGVELEGAWKVVPKGITLEHDGSVFRGKRVAGLHYGELPIGPMQPAAMPKFMTKYYPSVVDHTCGMHVHMSFESLRYYAWLMVPEFKDTMIDALSQWAKVEGFKPEHHIWDRLGGKNEFCQDKFWPDDQIAKKMKGHDHNEHGHRYTNINYSPMRTTIEVRVLPMTTGVEQAIRAIWQVVYVTNACVQALAVRHDRESVKLDTGLGEIHEETIEDEIPLTSGERRLLARR